DHPWRQDEAHFDGTVENNPKPRSWSGEEILERLSYFDFGVLSNDADVKKCNPIPPHDLSYWDHKSIFFELPYWSKLKLRNNLDAMHIEKNVCDSVVGTILGIKFKTKDTPKARKDLESMNLRRPLWLRRDRKGVYNKMPDAPYTVKPTLRRSVFHWFKGVRYPATYAATITGAVDEVQHKFVGLKTHDYHVMLQRLIPVVIRPYLPRDVAEPIVALCRWWQRLCARELKKSDVVELQQQIVHIICKLERIFPPAFFDIMIHLMIHLPEQVLISGPVQYTWMYPQERYVQLINLFHWRLLASYLYVHILIVRLIL
ncbi:DUF4218 domain-containing protein, partial [Vibrio sp. D54]|uniref:DUF4218 domain-containing protein n=1 Tax=Vibrio sp. D54 TaxID=2912256 RepID=UPI001F3D3A98